ncbi:MAG: hypothetical protein F6K24_27225 [Okeania sp. SIO2D1]|nr:hypothetical protein [Okeania sp. SIO2D1]
MASIDRNASKASANKSSELGQNVEVELEALDEQITTYDKESYYLWADYQFLF